jgi:hypothetical protein
MTYLTGHDEKNPLVIADYPYGFKLRCEIRYWIETNNKGDRFVSQTVNPKTGRLNAPKYGTYKTIVVMYKNDIGHVHCASINRYTSKDEIKQFINNIGGIDKLNITQQSIINRLI